MKSCRILPSGQSQQPGLRQTVGAPEYKSTFRLKKQPEKAVKSIFSLYLASGTVEHRRVSRFNLRRVLLLMWLWFGCAEHAGKSARQRRVGWWEKWRLHLCSVVPLEKEDYCLGGTNIRKNFQSFVYFSFFFFFVENKASGVNHLAARKAKGSTINNWEVSECVRELLFDWF